MTMETETQRINTHGFVMPNGRHAGELITRVPVSYLKWMVNIRHSSAAEAEAELTRRGTVTPDLEVSGHAIDRASLHCREIWLKDTRAGEGLHAWLVRVAGEALEHGERRGEKVLWKGMKFAFEEETVWPVLKTVMR